MKKSQTDSTDITKLIVLEIRDSQKLAKQGLGGKALFTRVVASNEEIKRFLNIVTILMSMVFS